MWFANRCGGAAQVAPAGAAPGGYSFTSFGVVGLRNTFINGINSSGAFTGSGCDATCAKTALFVDSDGRITRFTIPLKGSTEMGAGTAGIDGEGDVVGDYLDSSGVIHGFERTAAGTVTAVDAPGAGTREGGTEVSGISPGGVIVGSYIAADGVAHGFVDRDGRFRTYDEPEAGRTRGDGTDVTFYDGGELGGYYYYGKGIERSFYTRGGVAHTVSDPELRHSAADFVEGVDSSGNLYGAIFGAGEVKGFVDRAGVFGLIRDPAEVASSPSGNPLRESLDGTELFNASPSGVVVGAYSYDKNGDVKGFIARPRT